jgi:hypothetical protein
VARKVDSVIVAFEEDVLGPAACSGWSVTVTGRAALVTGPGTIARYRAVPPVPWVPGARDTFMTITTELAEGRRVRRSMNAPGRGAADAGRLRPELTVSAAIYHLDAGAARLHKSAFTSSVSGLRGRPWSCGSCFSMLCVMPSPYSRIGAQMPEHGIKVDISTCHDLRFPFTRASMIIPVPRCHRG